MKRTTKDGGNFQQGCNTSILSVLESYWSPCPFAVKGWKVQLSESQPFINFPSPKRRGFPSWLAVVFGFRSTGTTSERKKLLTSIVTWTTNSRCYQHGESGLLFRVAKSGIHELVAARKACLCCSSNAKDELNIVGLIVTLCQFGWPDAYWCQTWDRCHKSLVKLE